MEEGRKTVCVTGASGYIGSCLVKTLLDRGYIVRATVRDPGSMKKVKHLLDLRNASTNLSLWKADLAEEGSYDDAIRGCEGVFHVATPMEFLYLHHAGKEEIESTMVNGILSIMRSCFKAKTVKRFLYTSSIFTCTMQPQPPLHEYNENMWSDVDFCCHRKMFGWMHAVAKIVAEKAAWKYAEENGIDMLTIHPSLVAGHFITPYTSFSIDATISLYTKEESTMAWLKNMNGISAVHVEDVCNAHVYLYEHPEAKGRYICSSHIFKVDELAHSLRLKYPDRNITDESFEGLEDTFVVPCSSKKLMDLGFKFAHKNRDAQDLCIETIESCREKGLL